MTRLLPLALIVAGLCTGCATPRHSETDVLVSEIIRQQAPNVACPVGDVRMCAVDVDDSLVCQCTDHRSVFGGR